MQPHRRGIRAYVALVVICLVALPAIGCGGGGDIAEAGDSIAALEHASAGSAAAAKAAKGAQKALERLTNDDAIESHLRGAFCTGVTSIANTGQLPNASDWHSFLLAELERSLVGVSITELEEKAEQFEADGHIDQITNPAVANRYLVTCILER